MSAIGQRQYKKTALFGRYSVAQTQQAAVQDPFLASSSIATLVATRQLTHCVAVIIAVLLLHIAIWLLAKFLATQPLPKPQNQAVSIEIIKAVEPPKIPPVVEKPVQIPPVIHKAPAATPQHNKPIRKAAPQQKPTVLAQKPVEQTVSVRSTPVVAPAAQVPEPAKPVVAEKSTDAKGYAGYLGNPKAEYPEIALERGWQGSVILRVKVAANGQPSSVSIKSSSGRKVLDSAAQRAVRGWHFAPATRGNQPVEGWVDVPIHFKLP